MNSDDAWIIKIIPVCYLFAAFCGKWLLRTFVYLLSLNTSFPFKVETGIVFQKNSFPRTTFCVFKSIKNELTPLANIKRKKHWYGLNGSSSDNIKISVKKMFNVNLFMEIAASDHWFEPISNVENGHRNAWKMTFDKFAYFYISPDVES